MLQEAGRSWLKALDPRAVRSNLLLAGLLLTAYELVRSTIVDKVRSFFCWEYRGAKLIDSDEYRDHVISRHEDRLHASCLWLQDMGALEQRDLTTIGNARKHRNALAHELPRFLADARKHVDSELLAEMQEVLAKVGRWFIREVEIPSDPQCDGKTIDDSDILSGNSLLLQVLIDAAIGSPGRASKLYESVVGELRRRGIMS